MSWNTQIGEGREERNSRRRGMGRIGGTVEEGRDRKEIERAGSSVYFRPGRELFLHKCIPPSTSSFHGPSSTMEAN